MTTRSLFSPRSHSLKFLGFDFGNLVLRPWQPRAKVCKVSLLVNLRLRLIREALPLLKEGKQHSEEKTSVLLKLDVVDLQAVQALSASHADLVNREGNRSFSS